MKDFSWGIVVAVAVGVLALGILMKIISPSLPAGISQYVPSSLKT